MSDDLITQYFLTVSAFESDLVAGTRRLVSRPGFISIASVPKFSPLLSTEHLIHPTVQSRPSGDTIPRIFTQLGFCNVKLVPQSRSRAKFSLLSLDGRSGIGGPRKRAFEYCDYLHIVDYKTANSFFAGFRLFTSRGWSLGEEKLLILRLNFSIKRHGEDTPIRGWSRESFGIRLNDGGRVSTRCPELDFGFHRIRIYQIVFGPVSEMRVLKWCKGTSCSTS